MENYMSNKKADNKKQFYNTDKDAKQFWESYSEQIYDSFSRLGVKPTEDHISDKLLKFKHG